MLKEAGIDLATLKHDRNMDDVDDFDFICHIAYGKKTLTRRERAEQVKKRDVFSKYGEQARLVLEALLDKYMDEGISELENLSVLKTIHSEDLAPLQTLPDCLAASKVTLMQ